MLHVDGRTWYRKKSRHAHLIPYSTLLLVQKVPCSLSGVSTCLCPASVFSVFGIAWPNPLILVAILRTINGVYLCLVVCDLRAGLSLQYQAHYTLVLGWGIGADAGDGGCQWVMPMGGNDSLVPHEERSLLTVVRCPVTYSTHRSLVCTVLPGVMPSVMSYYLSMIRHLPRVYGASCFARIATTKLETLRLWIGWFYSY